MSPIGDMRPIRNVCRADSTTGLATIVAVKPTDRRLRGRCSAPALRVPLVASLEYDLVGEATEPFVGCERVT